jgi:hypothetical protein
MKASLSDLMRLREEEAVQRSSELEHQLRDREREMSELKEAYKEKLRKCQAWEKVI